MNLIKMFEMQKVLDAHINEKHPVEESENRMMDNCLALLVELGECANEYRTFKYWSWDREPRKEELIPCEVCEGSGYAGFGYCGNCHGGYVGVKNPLLEEYADVLHFTLSIGNEINFIESVRLPLKPESYLGKFSVNWVAHDTFGYLFNKISVFMGLIANNKTDDIQLEYLFLLKQVFALGKWLGFTFEEIEKAYLEKNKINHLRQESDY